METETRRDRQGDRETDTVSCRILPSCQPYEKELGAREGRRDRQTNRQADRQRQRPSVVWLISAYNYDYSKQKYDCLVNHNTPFLVATKARLLVLETNKAETN